MDLDNVVREAEKSLPEYSALAEKVESGDRGALSFFAWFGFIGSRRYVSAEESAEANRVVAENRERRRRKAEKSQEGKVQKAGNSKDGEDQRGKAKDIEEDEDVDVDVDVDVDDDSNGDESDSPAAEIFSGGEELATLLAEDIWPHAEKYFSMFDFSLQLSLLPLPLQLPLPLPLQLSFHDHYPSLPTLPSHSIPSITIHNISISHHRATPKLTRHPSRSPGNGRRRPLRH